MLGIDYAKPYYSSTLELVSPFVLRILFLLSSFHAYVLELLFVLWHFFKTQDKEDLLSYGITVPLDSREFYYFIAKEANSTEAEGISFASDRNLTYSQLPELRDFSGLSPVIRRSRRSEGSNFEALIAS